MELIKNNNQNKVRSIMFKVLILISVFLLLFSSCKREGDLVLSSHSDISKVSSVSEDKSLEVSFEYSSEISDNESIVSTESENDPSSQISKIQPTQPQPTITKSIDSPVPYQGTTFDDSVVSIIQNTTKTNASDLTQADIDKMVKDAVNAAGGFSGLIKEGDTVVLKPNLVTTRDYTLPKWQGVSTPPEVNGNTTDYRLVRAAAKMVREYNGSSGKIYVMEGSSEATSEAYIKMRYTKQYIPEVDEFYAIENVSGTWGDYVSDKIRKVTLIDGLLHDTYYWNKLMYDADVLINLPTLKNHWDAIITGGVKNIGIGATPANIYANSENDFSKGNMSRNSMVDHGTLDLHKWIADFYSCRPADFTITDALQGLQNGPTPCFEIGGYSVGSLEDNFMNLRTVLAGRDGVAVDTVGANIMNWDPGHVPYLQYLSDKGVGKTDARSITVTGNRKVGDIRTDFAGVVVNKAAKGAMVEDKTAPVIRNLKAGFDGQQLEVSYETSSDSIRVDIYIDGKLIWKNTTGKQSIKFNVGGLQSGTYEICAESTDKYFNCAAVKTTAKKSAEMLYLTDGSYMAPYASSAPIINGIGNEGAWKRAPWATIDDLWLGAGPSSSDFSGRYKMVWTQKALYIMAEITDDVFSDKYPDPLHNYYDDDCLEFFVDEDASGGDHQTDHNAFAYHVSMFGDVVDINRSGIPQLYNEHVDSIVIYDLATKKYVWEMEVKIFSDTYSDLSANSPVDLQEGKTIGYALAYCDADGSGTREHFIGSIEIEGSDKNVAWQTADVFGKLTLVK